MKEMHDNMRFVRCDRCGWEMDTGQTYGGGWPRHEPTGWASVDVAVDSGTEDLGGRYDLCPRCRTEFMTAFMGKDPRRAEVKDPFQKRMDDFAAKTVDELVERHAEALKALADTPTVTGETVVDAPGEPATAPEYDHGDVAAETQTPEVRA